MIPRYIVQPDPRGGFSLRGPRIPYALWYLDDIHAVSFAHHIGRDTGGTVIVLDSTGRPAITEHIEAERRLVRPGAGLSV